MLKLKNIVKPVHKSTTPRILSIVEIYDNSLGLPSDVSAMYLVAMLSPPTTPTYRKIRIPIEDKSDGSRSVRTGISGITCCWAKLPSAGMFAKGTRKMFGSDPSPISCPSSKKTALIPNIRLVNNGANKTTFVIYHIMKLLLSILKSGYRSGSLERLEGVVE